MIIIKTSKFYKTFSQFSYNSIVNLVSLDNLLCPNCKESRFHHHGSYFRMVFDGHFSRSFNINRVKCIACGSTHAILLYPMVPYSHDHTVIEFVIHHTLGILGDFYEEYQNFISRYKIKIRILEHFPT